MTAPDFRPLGFGEILDGAFTLYRRNLVTFLVTSLIPILPMMALMGTVGVGMFTAMASGDPAAVMGAMAGFTLFMLVLGLAYLFMFGALTREAAQSYQGQPTSVGDGMRTGLGKLLPILGAGIVAGIGLLVAYVAVMIVFVVVTAVGALTGSTAVALILSLIGGLAAVALYMVAVAMLFAVVPAIVVENKGPIESISRSFDLARGARGRVVGLMVVTILITYLPVLAVGLLTGAFANIADPSAIPTTGQVMTQQLLGLAVGVLTTPFLVAVIVLLYFDRRVRTEALDVQMAAERLAVAGS